MWGIITLLQRLQNQAGRRGQSEHLQIAARVTLNLFDMLMGILLQQLPIAQCNTHQMAGSRGLLQQTPLAYRLASIGKLQSCKTFYTIMAHTSIQLELPHQLAQLRLEE